MCPGTTSSGAWLVDGVTSPSPSILISSGAYPVADNNDVPLNAPPLNCVSYSSALGKKLPSLVLLRNMIRSLSLISIGVSLVKFGNSMVLIIPLPTKVCITMLDGAIFNPLGWIVDPSYKLKYGSSILTPFT